MSYRIYQTTERKIEEDATQVLKLVVELLYRQNVLTRDQFEHYINNHAVVLREESFFKKLFSRKKAEEEPLEFVIVERLTGRKKELTDEKISELLHKGKKAKDDFEEKATTEKGRYS